MIDLSSFDLDQINKVYETKEGGQKKVYIAKHKRYGSVALKLILNDPPDQRILREIDILKSISSQYYPRLYHVNHHSINDKTYIVIIEEFIKGKELFKVYDLFKEEAQLQLLTIDLLNALNILWCKNTVHRDIKPGNIMIRPNLKPVILDLGIAKQLDKESLTATSQMIGPCTLIYASPEQLENNKEIIGPRTDMFSLGIVLFILATGKHPFNLQDDKSVGQVADTILRDDPPEPNSLNKDITTTFSNFIIKLLQKQPFQRFRNYQSAIKALKGEIYHEQMSVFPSVRS